MPQAFPPRVTAPALSSYIQCNVLNGSNLEDKKTVIVHACMRACVDVQTNSCVYAAKKVLFILR